MRLIRYAGLFLSLFSFWLLLSGLFKPLLLGFGAVSVLLVAWIKLRMDRADGEAVSVHLSWRIFGYGLWLLWSITKSSLDVAIRIWHPRLPIHPLWNRVNIKLRNPVEKALYANSITLTPGTMTTDVRDGHFLVHSLSEVGIDNVRSGEMESRIRRLRL